MRPFVHTTTILQYSAQLIMLLSILAAGKGAANDLYSLKQSVTLHKTCNVINLLEESKLIPIVDRIENTG